MKKLLICIFAIVVFVSVTAQETGQDWPVFRGRPDLSGFTAGELTSAPSLLWSYKSGSRSRSSPVISNGTIFFGNDKGTVLAVTADGKLKWKYE